MNLSDSSSASSLHTSLGIRAQVMQVTTVRPYGLRAKYIYGHLNPIRSACRDGREIQHHGKKDRDRLTMGRILDNASDSAREEVVWPIESFTIVSEVGLVLVVSLCQLLTQAALGMSLAPLLIIGRHFGIDHEPGQMSWSPAAYSLTVGTFILVAGRFGDLYGHRRAVLVGWLWFGVCGLAAGTSWFEARFDRFT